MTIRRGGLVALTVTAIWLTMPQAVADSPSQKGWWTATNPGAAIGGVGAPSDVPAGGLLVQGAASSPTAYAALLFQLPQSATVGNLTLNVASGSVSTATTSIQLCPLVKPTFQPEQGGPLADAPAFDCTSHVEAAPNNGTYRFAVTTLVRDATLAVAVVGTGATDRVVFAPPDTSTLTMESGAPASPGGSDQTAAGQPGATSGSFPLPSNDLSLPVPAAAGTGIVPAPISQTPAPQLADVGDPKPALLTQEADTKGPALAALGAVVIAVFIGATLWSYAGHPDVAIGGALTETSETTRGLASELRSGDRT